MIVVATPLKPVYDALRKRLRLSGGESASVARGGGVTLVCRELSDAREFLDEATGASGAETIVFATIGAALGSDHETGDVVLPNVVLPPDGRELPPIFLDLYPDQEDLLYEDAFGLSVGGIAVDAAPAPEDDEATAELRARSQADVAVPGIYALAATHRVGGYDSVFVPVVGIERPGSVSGLDPVESLSAAVEFLRDSFA